MNYYVFLYKLKRNEKAEFIEEDMEAEIESLVEYFKEQSDFHEISSCVNFMYSIYQMLITRVKNYQKASKLMKFSVLKNCFLYKQAEKYLDAKQMILI